MSTSPDRNGRWPLLAIPGRRGVTPQGQDIDNGGQSQIAGDKLPFLQPDDHLEEIVPLR
ncbi:MAG: hypothetical protein ABFD20_11605 [Anaerolineales bacterium]